MAQRPNDEDLERNEDVETKSPGGLGDLADQQVAF
jgi:hypothetical protein